MNDDAQSLLMIAVAVVAFLVITALYDRWMR